MVVLYRIDERLIHGQVVLGWGRHLGIERYIVADDELGASEWEREIYRMGSGNADVLFASVAEAIEKLSRWRCSPDRAAVLTREIPAMRRLADDGGLAGSEVNLGGLHHRRDRRRYLSYIHLTEQERDELLRMEHLQVRVSARDLPETTPVSLSALLSRGPR